VLYIPTGYESTPVYSPSTGGTYVVQGRYAWENCREQGSQCR
jgi:hypothetical protein